jgi:hypothetical protein
MVHSLLATGTEDDLRLFNFVVSLYLNCIDRRAQTVRYTCGAEHLEFAKEAAQTNQIVLQEIVRTDDGETYPALVGDASKGWPPPRNRRKPREKTP